MGLDCVISVGKNEGVAVETPRLHPPTPGVYYNWFIQPMAEGNKCSLEDADVRVSTFRDRRNPCAL